MRQHKEWIFFAFFVFLMLSICLSCGTKTIRQNQDDQSEPIKYKLIRDNLYEDKSGSLWFKTIDATNPDNPQEKYIDLIWSNNFEEDTKKLIEVIDPRSFKSLDADYYRDKTYIYHFFPLADGGSLRIVDEAQNSTFRVFEHSFFAGDETYVYFKGSKMDGVDVPSFEPIIIETEGIKIGWYAKDKSNYYNGRDIMTAYEIELLKSELDMNTNQN